MAITNMRAFSNVVKKQYSIHYNVLPTEVTSYTVEYIAEMIEFNKGNHAILTDYLYSNNDQSHGIGKARSMATVLLNYYN